MSPLQNCIDEKHFSVKTSKQPDWQILKLQAHTNWVTGLQLPNLELIGAVTCCTHVSSSSSIKVGLVANFCLGSGLTKSAGAEICAQIARISSWVI